MSCSARPRIHNCNTTYEDDSHKRIVQEHAQVVLRSNHPVCDPGGHKDSRSDGEQA